METVATDLNPMQGNVLSKIQKILVTRLDNDKETLEALKELSTFCPENTLHSRRNLRSKIEKRSLAINEGFLSAFSKVKDALDSVYSDVISMDAEVKSMTSQLQATRTQTHQLIEHTTQLQAQSKKLSLEQEVAAAFLGRFQLSSEELNALHGSTRDSPITPAFFSALQHAQSIHAECRILIQSGFQTAALDIMEQMSLYQESALERLYRWTQSHCRNIESNETAALLTEAMACLQDRPVLYKYVLDEYASCRRAGLVRAFIDALTKGGPGGMPRPIEMHADDPKRYVGDMLGWLHQTVPSERECVLTLLKICTKTDVSEHTQQVLRFIFEGVCHPLKVRVERILSADSSTTVLYSVASLLGFYHQVIGQVVPDSVLQSTLADLRKLAQQHFLSALEARVKQHLSDRLDAPPPDLSPSPSVSALLTLLKEVLSVAGVSEERPQDIGQMVGVVLDPLLQAVNLSAARLPTTDMAVYLLNCLYQMQTTLSLYGFMDERLERLQAQSDAQLDTLTSEQASSLVANLTLGPIYTILQEPSRGPLSSVPGMDATSLKHFLVKLDGFLALPDVLLLPQISLLLSTVHRNAVQQRAFQVICTVYSQLYSAVHDPANGYQNPAALVQKNPEQVQELLLGCGRQEKHLLLMSTASAVPNNLSVNATSNTGFAEEIAVIHPGYVSIIPIDDKRKAKYVAVRSSTGETLLAHVSQVMWCQLGTEVWFIIASSLGIQVFDTEAETCYFMHSCQDSAEPVDGNTPHFTTIGSQLLCVGNSSGSIYVFRILDRQCQAVLVDRQKGHKHGISAMDGSVSLTTNMLASGDQDGNIVIWTVDKDRLHKDASFPSYGFACTSLKLWQNYIVVAYGSGHIRLFSAQPTAAMLVEIAAHARWITALDLASDSGRLLSVAEDALIRIWQLNEQQPMIEHQYVCPMNDSLLVGARFLTSTGSTFCISSYDSCEVHCFHAN